MIQEVCETDYLIVGAGAMGLAFADVIFDEQPSARIVIVDRRSRPGGHWNDAYRFVRLHQPAAFYGVNSAALGTGGADLSSQAELLAYFERALQRMLASERVTYLPLHEHIGSGRVRSLATGQRERTYRVSKRVVDAGYMQVEVPATHKPAYTVEPGLPLAPVNALATLRDSWERYAIIGGGKTGIDAVLFLLEAGVPAECIVWIIPNDSWLWNRARIQPHNAIDELLRQARVIADSDSLDAAFLQLEKDGSVFRLDNTALPTKWRCATVAEDEFQALRQVRQIVRDGRVSRITADSIVMERGSVATDARTLHVDCSANGLCARPAVAVFEEGAITLQSLLMCQQVFSAAVIGHVESMQLDDGERNAMWQVVPHPEQSDDLGPCLLQSLENLVTAQRHMSWWLRCSRLNLGSHVSLLRYLGTGLRARRLLPAMRAAVQRGSAGSAGR